MKSTLLFLTLGGLLAAAVAVALYTWDQMSGVTMSAHGVVALVLGVVVSLGLGVGLMVLVFYSNRKGYDRIDGGAPDRAEDEAASRDDAETRSNGQDR